MFLKETTNVYLRLSRKISGMFYCYGSDSRLLFHANELNKRYCRNYSGIWRILFFSFLLLFYYYDFSFSQDNVYKINKKDLLEITFWEYPEMNAQVRVHNDGTISLPIIGSLKVEGSTIPQLNKKIITQMGIYNKVVNQVYIKVLEYGYNKVIVTGQVFSPGKYYFEEIPDLWEIIMEAGGPLEGARLDEVQIIRKENEGEVITARVATALKDGKVSELPKVFPGDAVHVRGASSPYKVSTKGYVSNEFFIVGEVGSPGVQEFEENLNILDAIGQAGGPTSDANLSKVSYVVVHEGGTTVSKINLKHYLNNSLSTPLPIVEPGSTIFIPRRSRVSPFLTTILTTAIASTITAIIYVSVR